MAEQGKYFWDIISSYKLSHYNLTNSYDQILKVWGENWITPTTKFIFGWLGFRTVKYLTKSPLDFESVHITFGTGNEPRESSMEVCRHERSFKELNVVQNL